MMARVCRVCVSIVIAVAVTSGCVGTNTTPGMHAVTMRAHDRDATLVELARIDPNADERPLLVVYPKSACSASASAVLVDDHGRFLGSVAPGHAALLSISKAYDALTLFSSVEVTAPKGTWHEAKRVTLPAAPNALVLRSARFTARECGPGPYFDVEIATKTAIESELAEIDVRWLMPDRESGQAWLDAHRERIVEVLSTPPSRMPGDVTHLVFR